MLLPTGLNVFSNPDPLLEPTVATTVASIAQESGCLSPSDEYHVEIGANITESFTLGSLAIDRFKTRMPNNEGHRLHGDHDGSGAISAYRFYRRLESGKREEPQRQFLEDVFTATLDQYAPLAEKPLWVSLTLKETGREKKIEGVWMKGYDISYELHGKRSHIALWAENESPHGWVLNLPYFLDLFEEEAPLHLLANIRQIQIFLGKNSRDGDFHARGSLIRIFNGWDRVCKKTGLEKTFWHEVGHAVADGSGYRLPLILLESFWKKTLRPLVILASHLDGKPLPDSYSQSSAEELWAEMVHEYMTAPFNFRAQHPHRARLVDLAIQNVWQKARRQQDGRRELLLNGSFGLALLNSAAGMIMGSMYFLGAPSFSERFQLGNTYCNVASVLLGAGVLLHDKYLGGHKLPEK